MLNLGLSADEQAAFHAALRTHRRIAVRLDVLDMDQKHLTSIDNRLLSGEVTVDGTADVSRSMSVTLLDPAHRLRLDSDAPDEGALYADRMLRATYLVRVGGEWVDVPVFTGPITKLDRDEATVSVECQGKEVLAQQAAWTPMTLDKGLGKIDAIRRIMRERAGESKFDFPEGKARLPSNVSLGREDIPWEFAQKIARGMDKQLFYDGRGRLRLRNLPDRVSFTFNERVITSVPQVSFDMSEARNAVRVVGRNLHEGKETGKGDNVEQIPTEQTGGVAVAERSHPLSPHRLGRNGTPRYIAEFIVDDTIRSNKEAVKVAERTLRDRLRQAVEVSMDVLPVPHLEPGDTIGVSYGDIEATARLQQFGFSLTSDGSMSIGYTRRVSRPSRSRRRVNRK